VGVPASVQFDSSYEYGLRLPDGNAVWPPDQWFGHTFQTPEERNRLLVALQTSIANMSLPVETLGQYRWLKRETQIITVEREVVVTDHEIDGDLTFFANDCCSADSPDDSEPVVDTVGGGYVQS